MDRRRSSNKRSFGEVYEEDKSPDHDLLDSQIEKKKPRRSTYNFSDFKDIKEITTIKDKYRIMELIAEGAYGQVRKAQNIKTNEIVAVKILKKEYIRET